MEAHAGTTPGGMTRAAPLLFVGRGTSKQSMIDSKTISEWEAFAAHPLDRETKLASPKRHVTRHKC